MCIDGTQSLWMFMVDLSYRIYIYICISINVHSYSSYIYYILYLKVSVSVDTIHYNIYIYMYINYTSIYIIVDQNGYTLAVQDWCFRFMVDIS